MEAHRRAPPGTRLIDGAIALLSLLLAGWVAVIVVARSQEGETGAHVASDTPPQSGVAGAFQRSKRNAGWRLAWRDEFNEARCPSRAKWSFEHGFVRNGELQWYQPQNAYCHDGVLVLEARREEKRNPDYRPRSTYWPLNVRVAEYTSASIASRYSFTYGRAEALIRIDPRPGSWQDFWTLGTSFRRDPNSWPGTGEVDIMEYYRNLVLANVCNPKPTWCGWLSTRQSLASLGGQAWADRFHLWAMDWNARRIDLFLDGKLVHRFAVADATGAKHGNPYVNQPAFLLLSQAIGGAHGGDPTNTAFPVRLEVGYVRVYQRAHDKGRRTGS
jgi:beta-glucanase (GH16 family)